MMLVMRIFDDVERVGQLCKSLDPFEAQSCGRLQLY